MASLLPLLLSTACSIIAVVAAVVASRERDRATREADALRNSRGRLIALEHSVEAIDTRVKRVIGTVYEARSRARAKATIDNDTGEVTDEEFQAMLDLQRADGAATRGAH